MQGDVLGDLLDAARFTTLFFGRFDLGAPWALDVPEKETSSFYIVARGGARLTAGGEATPLAAGDLVLLPRGLRHRLSDGSRGARAIPSAQLRSGVRLGGPGPTTTLVSGCFRFSLGKDHPILRSLPTTLLFPGDDPRRSAALSATIAMLASESSTPESGSAIVLGRLTDVLLVHALRLHGAAVPALADPKIARALSLIHGRPGDDWTVPVLAAAVGLSRTAFMQRFHARVGEPPLRYLTQWRMLRAASALEETDLAVDEIAATFGYDSGPAFQKAFKRWQGVGPGAWRRARRGAYVQAP